MKSLQITRIFRRPARAGLQVVDGRGEDAAVVRLQRSDALRDPNGFSRGRRFHAENADRWEG